MTFNLRGQSALMQDLNDAMAASDASIEEYNNFIIRSTARRAKDAIRGGAKTGRIYERKNPLRTVQASAPGEAPADDLGNLADSIRFQLFSTSGMVGFVEVGAYYGITLEFGDAKIAPRPFLYPAFREALGAAKGRWKEDFEARL